MKPRQPDFRQLFYDHFGTVPKKVAYNVRQDSNRYHDLVFLASLIHDARFKMKRAVLKGNRLTIPLNRDCWELGITQRAGIGELHIADAKLTIASVISVEWRFPHGFEAQAKELWIGSIWLNPEGDSETRDLVIDGDDWKCIITLNTEDIRIRLVDAETPYLYSERKKRKKAKA
jgi:hypothetical protein